MTTHDWDAIERDYRAGQISIRQLCLVHRISRSDLMMRADKDGWTRNLTSTVRAVAADRLLYNDALGGDPEDVIDAAAQRAVAIVLSHRKDIARLRNTVSGLTEMLDRIASGCMTDDDRIVLGKIGPAEVADKLAAALGKLITLERQSHNLDALLNPNTGVALPGSDPAAGPSVTFYLPNNNRGNDD